MLRDEFPQPHVPHSEFNHGFVPTPTLGFGDYALQPSRELVRGPASRVAVLAVGVVVVVIVPAALAVHLAVVHHEFVVVVETQVPVAVVRRITRFFPLLFLQLILLVVVVHVDHVVLIRSDFVIAPKRVFVLGNVVQVAALVADVLQVLVVEGIVVLERLVVVDVVVVVAVVPVPPVVVLTDVLASFQLVVVLVPRV